MAKYKITMWCESYLDATTLENRIDDIPWLHNKDYVVEETGSDLVTLVRVEQTCSARPSQWDAWDTEGNCWYLRYRWGRGSVQNWDDEYIPDREFDLTATRGEYDGTITLEEFCELAGLRLNLT